MPRCVLGSPDVQINLAPIIRLFSAAKSAVIVRVHVPQEVPTRPGPSRHRVVFHAISFKNIPVFLLRPRERWLSFFGRQVGIYFRKRHLLVLYEAWNFVFVTNWERLAPIPLATEDSIAQPVIDLLGSKTLGLQYCNCGRNAILTAQTVERFRVAKCGRFLGKNRLIRVFAFENWRNGQSKCFGEFPISLIASRHCHDGARSITGKNIIGDPNGQRLSRHWVDGERTGVASGYLLLSSALALPFGFQRSSALVMFNGLSLRG